MQYHHKTIVFSGQERLIKASPAFRMSDVAVALSLAFGYSANTVRQYARAIIANVRAESGDEVLERHGNVYRWA